METNPLVTRQVWVRSIADGQDADFMVNGDYFFIDQLYTVSTSADVQISMSVNDLSQASAAPVRVNESLQGTPGQLQIKKVKFFNRSGGTIYIAVIYGRGQRFTTSRTTVAGTLAIDATTIAAIATAIVAAQAVPNTGACNETQVADGQTKTFSGMSGILIFNTSAVPILVNGIALAVGDNTGWNANGRYDLLGAVVVNCATTPGGSADVVYVGGAVA